MPLESTPTRPTKVHALYDVRADDATRPDIIPAPARFAEDATRPDIVPARLRFEEESFDSRDDTPRYVRTEYLAHEDWPDVRLAHRRSRSGTTDAVVLHRPHRRIAKAAGVAQQASIADLLEQRLRHPLVVPVLDLVSLDGELLVVSEYVAGVTLSELLREGGPLRPALALAIACDVLRALHAGHGASAPGERCVHGSLSPREVLVCADGRSRLVDFSLAEAASASNAERSRGRAGYVAPEQVFDRRSDPRTDVFLVGVALWESLTGCGLLAGRNPFERLMKLVREGFEPPSRFNAEVPDWLDEAVGRALDPAAERRFQSAAEFASALAATLRPASAADVAEYVGLVGGPCIERQRVSRRAASEPPPASGTRRTRATNGARVKADPRTVPTVRPPKLKTIERTERAVSAAAPATVEGKAEERVAEARVPGQPAAPSEARRPPPSHRPPRSLRVSAYCAASAAIALLAAVTGVELARAVNHVEVIPAPVVAQTPPAPTPKRTTAPAVTKAVASSEPLPSTATSDVPVVDLDELPVAKASKRVKPSRRWRAPARR